MEIEQMSGVDYRWPDIDFFAVVTPGEYVMEFEVWECSFLTPETLFYRNSADNAEDCPTEDRQAATVFASGGIKWDGCVNMRFDAQDCCALHFCGREDALRVGVLFGRLYDLAAELIPTWIG